MYEQPTVGRRIGPALIAFLVVLAIAAGVVGYYGARRVLGLGGPGADQTHDTAAGGSTGSPATATSKTTDPQPDSTAQPTTTASVPPGDPTKCPGVTAQALTARGLNGDLTLLRYVLAERKNRFDAEVWVCRNADDLLVYQGHVLNGPLDEADNGRNSILLAEGIKGTVVADPANEGAWIATNTVDTNITKYHVSATALRLVNPNGTEEYTVIKTYPR